MRMLRSWTLSIVFVALFFVPSIAQTPRPVATITQLQLGKLGGVGVILPGGAREKAGGFQTLLPGTKIDVLNDATVEIYFFDGRTQTITRENSPYEIVPPKRKLESISNQLIELGKILFDKKSPKEKPGYVRGGSELLLAPRHDTRIMTSWPKFEWQGRIGSPAALTLSGPNGALWSTTDLPADAMQYPKTAPVLVPGVHYSWTVKARDSEHSGGGFTILTDTEAGMIKKRLAELESQNELGQATRRVLQISYLISEGLYYDARERLIEALKADGEEPTLRLLLAEVYEKTGLANLANEQVRVALDLARREKNRQ
jgi:hypothetical protein